MIDLCEECGMPFRSCNCYDETPSRPSWNEYFLSIAEVVATRADCSRRRVGAVVVDRDHRIVSTGYNGSPPGGPSCLAGECPRGRSDVPPGSSYDTGPGTCHAIHAEGNALLWADPTRVRNGNLYISAEPCEGCWRLIRGMKLSRVIWPEGATNLP